MGGQDRPAGQARFTFFLVYWRLSGRGSMISNGHPHHAANPRTVHFPQEVLDSHCTPPRGALRELLAAHHYSLQVGRDVWDFAVTVHELRFSGLTESDLRWLVCEELVQHACEVTRIGDHNRQFQTTHPLVFTAHDCFILTDRGCDYARSILAHEPAPRRVAAPSPTTQDEEQPAEASRNGLVDAPSRPRWEPDRHELRLGSVLVKQFKWPAMNQETILAAFQEEDWPVRIDDPLPPQPDQDSKRRLSDTIKCLNRKQKNPLLHFRGDGTGEGVIWETVEHISRT